MSIRFQIHQVSIRVGCLGEAGCKETIWVRVRVRVRIKLVSERPFVIDATSQARAMMHI